MTAPRATYRLQFRQGMDFERAARLAPYLAALGISHLYASPLFQAAPGSTHGYDVADFNVLEPSLGGEDGCRHLAEALDREGLELILDMVPNHMAATPHNPWWREVLEWGQRSPYSGYFDIDWSQPKLIIPALGDAYGKVLERGEFSLSFDAADGGLAFGYYELKIPLTPPSYAQVLMLPQDEALTDFANRFAVANEETASELKAELAELAAGQRERAMLDRAVAEATRDLERLHALHEAQIWRLAHWRSARERLTYRRFFEIADLVGMRMEQPSVFDDTHRLVLRLAREGLVDGLRLDHVDGLADPKGYLRRLQEALGGDEPFYLLVEKILGPHENLPADWPVAGTTGYEFTDALAGLFTNPAGEAPLTEAYEGFIGERIDYAEALAQTKRRIFTRNLAGELDVLTHLAHELAEGELATRDLGPDTLRRAIIELAISLTVYRTYVDVEGPHDDDRTRIEAAVAQARTTREVEDESALDFIARLLLLDIPDPERRGKALVFAARFQQTTGPLMAKSVEDTLFYRYNRLIALNEVGSEPQRFGADFDVFHEAMVNRLERQPFGLLATSTHDTKRGEDARARLYALSEAPGTWGEACGRWRDMNAPLCAMVNGVAVPIANDSWLFYQTLMGAWPAGMTADDADGFAALADRMVQFMLKAAREAKLMTSWTVPDKAYEEALERFVRGVLDAERPGPFLRDFHATIQPFLAAGVVTSLAQTLIKLTVPGVPDIYQGSEFWDVSLVDPDNRRPADFDARKAALASEDDLPTLLETWADGRVKLRLLRALLEERRQAPALFSDGRYLPLALHGARADHGIAFARQHGSAACLTIVPCRPLALLEGALVPLIPAERWGETSVVLPPELSGRRWRNPLVGADTTAPKEGLLPLAQHLGTVPVTFLMADGT